MNRLLSLTTDLLNTASNTPPQASIGEAALYALIGFVVVFVGIALLIAVVWLVGKLLARLQGGVASESREEQSVTAPVKAVQTETESVDEETLAVITAAIMAYYEQQNSRCEFTVKRIKTIKRY